MIDCDRFRQPPATPFDSSAYEPGLARGVRRGRRNGPESRGFELFNALRGAIPRLTFSFPGTSQEA